ncbi:MAG: L,D-transpeptidase family protein [Gammaproteobacteria bacterium]|nr:L,D-transpeptidase family protein [Gammaproteobacteria bacterium]
MPDGPTIRPGADDPRLPDLARRLAISGDLGGNETVSSTTEYNETLQDAVRHFQNRHGLNVDALAGPATLRALNVPVEQRIDQLRVNMDRAQQFPGDQDDDYIFVNVPAFRAYVIRDGKTVLASKVVVGKKEDATPEFRSSLQQVVFNPTWTVPYSIASEEFLPEIKRDPGFFDKGGYQLFDRDGNQVDPLGIDWSEIASGTFPFTLMQKPGPPNQLGVIKFLFPNDFSVCMHDTPAKALFAKSVRTFSHGCIRIDEPLGFAATVLDSEGWTREQIDAQVGSGETRTVALSKPLPIFIAYRTAEVDDQGAVFFYDDIYQRDDIVLQMLDPS